jgi:hypothetical protein
MVKSATSLRGNVQKYNLMFLFLLISCATEHGKIGSVIMDNPLSKKDNETQLYKDKRYSVWAKGCGFANQFSSVTDAMIDLYNNANPEKEKAYGMADIEYEHRIDFIVPCLKMKGTPLIKKKHKILDVIPIELNYL